MKIYKYFLLHNKKLKPWIKYWLYIKSKDKNYVLSDILQGTSFYLENSSNKNFNLFQINGNSMQDGTPTPSNQVPINSAGDAKNLYFLPEEGSSNGINYTKNDDGTINLSGTATTAVTFSIFKSIVEAQIENGATYTFSSNQALPSGVEFRAEAFNNTSWLRHLIGGVINSSLSSRTGTANLSNATRIRHLIYIASGTTVNLSNLGIQFEKGSIKTSFTPEGKGFINETISNKNLLENTYTTSGTQGGITHTKNTDGTMLLNGTSTTTVFMVLNTFNLPAGTYILSGCPNGGSENGYRQDILIGSNVITRDLGSGGSFTLNESTSIQARIRIGSGTAINNLTFKPMIRLSSVTSTSFVEHQEQNISIPCQQPMRSIGEVRDSFIKQDGVWYEKHNLRQRILNGNENWISQTQTGFYRYGLSDSVINNETSYASQIIIKSDSFKGITFNNRNSDTNETIYAVSNGQQHNLFINTKSYTTLNDFKNWLTGNNIEVIYLLNEPNYIECTQEQIQALESIIRAYTYEPITNINSTDETPAFLKIQYYMEV